MYSERILSNDIINSVRSLLDSNITNKEIVAECSVAASTVSELRNGKKSLYNLSFSTVSDLYNFSMQKKLDSTSKEIENMKGKYSKIPLEIPVKKIVVAFKQSDLFFNGYFPNQNFFDSDSLTRIELSNTYFVTENNIIDAWDYDYKFQCNYGGTGPNNFVRFLSDFSKISIQNLKEVIFNNPVVCYDFESDTITALPSFNEEKSVILFKKNNKLILKLLNLNNNKSSRPISPLRGISGREHKQSDIYSVIEDIQFYREFLNKTYSLDEQIQKISYVNLIKESPDYEFDNSLFSNQDPTQLIIDFDNYELWIPYTIFLSNDRGEVFESEEMEKLLKAFNINYENKSFFKKLRKTPAVSVLDLNCMTTEKEL